MKKPWTPEELQTLREKYADTSSASLAVEIGHHSSSLRRMAKTMGLVKSEALQKTVSEARKQIMLAVRAAHRKKAKFTPREKLPGEAPAITFVQSAMSHIPQHQQVRAGGNDHLRIKSIGF